jgi:hypothetical protein
MQGIELPTGGHFGIYIKQRGEDMNYYIEKDGRKHSLLMIFSVIIGITYTVLFHKTIHLGLNYPIFLLMVFLFTYIMLNSEQFNKKTYTALCAVNFLYAAVYSVYMNTIIRSLNFVAVPILYIFTVILSQNNKADILNFIKSLFVPFLYIFRYFANIIKNAITPKVSTEKRKALTGILLSIILLAIIIPLMFSSDILLNAFFHDWFKNFKINVGDIIYYVFFFMLTSAYSYGFIRFAIEKRITLNENTEKYLINPPENINSSGAKNYNTQIFIVLCAVTIVYAMFCVFQSVFLIGGSVYGLPNNFDYAQYARSGFFQLVALTFINIAIILTVFKLTDDDKSGGIRRLLYIFTFLTLVLAVSSFYRMHLYEAAYGYTILRLLVYIMLIYEFIVILLIFIKIKNIKFSFMKFAFITGLIFYLIILYMNIDGYVAKKNVDRYFATGELDVMYLDELSTDATNQIMRLAGEKNSDIALLIQNKKFCLQDYADKKDFRFYNYSIMNALKIYNVEAQDIYKITVINNGSAAINSIALSNDKETQVMGSEIDPGQQCYFFIQDASIKSYTMTLIDADKKTYTQNMTLDFDNNNIITLHLEYYKGEWCID